MTKLMNRRSGLFLIFLFSQVSSEVSFIIQREERFLKLIIRN